MTGKGRRHDRGRHCVGCRHLLVVATILLIVGSGCEGANEARSPLAPEAARIARIEVNDIEVRLHNGLEWGPWQVVVDSMTTTVPWDDPLVMQFRRGADYSGIAGFSWPVLDTCFKMPAHEAGNSAWRITYGLEPGVYPDLGRQEFRGVETNMAEARHNQLWFRVELWDATLEAYDASSPWFRGEFTSIDTEYDVHEEQS